MGILDDFNPGGGNSRELELRMELSLWIADAGLIARKMRINSAGTPADLQCALADVDLLEEALIDVLAAFGDALDADMTKVRDRRRDLIADGFVEPLECRLIEWEAERSFR